MKYSIQGYFKKALYSSTFRGLGAISQSISTKINFQGHFQKTLIDIQDLFKAYDQFSSTFQDLFSLSRKFQESSRNSSTFQDSVSSDKLSIT